MSPQAKVILGVVFALAAICFAFVGACFGLQMAAGSLPFYALALFCVIIVVACFSRGSRPVTLRIIGTVIFCVYVWCAVENLGRNNLVPALCGLVMTGLPCGYLMVTGRYPKWGEWSAAFNSEDETKRSADPESHGS
jgi:hypothetical protein